MGSMAISTTSWIILFWSIGGGELLVESKDFKFTMDGTRDGFRATLPACNAESRSILMRVNEYDETISQVRFS
jgi:hypothetical protein